MSHPTKFVVEPGRQSIVMRRVFDAPRELVFQTYTDARYLPDWWGPRSMRTVVDYADIRPGGSWRVINIQDDGSEHPFHGVYHEVTAPERIVATFEYEPMPGQVELDLFTFAELPGGSTQYTATAVYFSVEARDAMAATDMETGATETMDRFAELLAHLRDG